MKLSSTSRSSVFLATLALLVCGFVGACDDTDSGDDAADTGDGDSDSDGDGYDETPIEDALANFPDGFEQVNATPFPTQGHAMAGTVNVWVQSAGVSAYGAIDPDATGSNPTFAEGLIIVKEQFDDGGTLSGYTVMTKGPSGYAPNGGGWWYGFANTDGALTNTSESGDISFCQSCHAARPDDDWLYGVPTDNRL